MEATDRDKPHSIGARVLEPVTLWDRVLRYGIFSLAASAILGFLFVIFRYVLYPVRVVLPPVAIAVVITYLLNPLVTRLEARGIRRGISVVLIYVVFLGVAGFLLSRVIPLVTHQVSAFVADLPRLLSRAAKNVNDFADKRGWDVHLKVCSPDEVACPKGYLSLERLVSENRDKITQFLGGVRSFAASALHVVINTIIGLVLSIYLLLDLPKIRQGFRNAIPARHRDEVAQVGEAVGRSVGNFFRGQLLVALFVGVASAIGLTLVKVPFAALVGMIAGIFNLVPLIGPFIGAVPAVILGLLSGEPIRALWGAVVLLIVQQIDNHIISPNVMGRTVKLHPITVMLSLLVAGTFAGIFGMLLVIPMVAAVKTISTHMWARRSVREAIAPVMVAEEDRRAAIVAQAAGEADEAALDGGDEPVPAVRGKASGGKTARRSTAAARSGSSSKPSRGSQASRSRTRSASRARKR